MRVILKHDFYDHTITMQELNSYCLAECIEKIREFCGGFVWNELETTSQEKPKYAKYVDTYYNINVYFDSVTETFLFEEF